MCLSPVGENGLFLRLKVNTCSLLKQGSARQHSLGGNEAWALGRALWKHLTEVSLAVLLEQITSNYTAYQISCRDERHVNGDRKNVKVIIISLPPRNEDLVKQFSDANFRDLTFSSFSQLTTLQRHSETFERVKPITTEQIPCTSACSISERLKSDSVATANNIPANFVRADEVFDSPQHMIYFHHTRAFLLALLQSNSRCLSCTKPRRSSRDTPPESSHP